MVKSVWHVIQSFISRHNYALFIPLDLTPYKPFPRNKFQLQILFISDCVVNSCFYKASGDASFWKGRNLPKLLLTCSFGVPCYKVAYSHGIWHLVLEDGAVIPTDEE